MPSSETLATDLREQYRGAGFTVMEVPGSSGLLELRKYDCVRYLERNSKGTWVLSGPPFFVIRGMNCELEDRGYQKFWYRDGRRFPVRRKDLETLHLFEEEVRSILGMKSLYNESLGSTCARSVYDRLTGRPDR